MKAEEKPRYVKELREILKVSDFSKLLDNPDDLEVVSGLQRVIAILKNFSFNDGEKLERMFADFKKWARAGERKEHIIHSLNDMVQFVGQKTEEMDVYHIDPEPKYDVKTIKKKLKDEELWFKAKKVSGDDEHIFIGENKDKSGDKVHLIAGKGGDLRFHSDDRFPGEILKKVTTLMTTKSGKQIVSKETSLSFGELDDKEEVSQKIPILNIEGMGKTGGPDGHFEKFKITNIGDEAAIDCSWGIRGFAYEWRPRSETPFTLIPKAKKEVVYKISGKKPFIDLVGELNFILEYKNSSGDKFFARREIKQVKVKSGAFFTLELGDFHPPTMLVDDGVEFLSGPEVVGVTKGDRVEGRFEIKSDGKVEVVTIGVSRTLLSVWGFVNDEGLVRQALLELGYRKIRKMIKDENLEDYVFISTNFPLKYQKGVEGYRLLRDSI